MPQSGKPKPMVQSSRVQKPVSSIALALVLLFTCLLGGSCHPARHAASGFAEAKTGAPAPPLWANGPASGWKVYTNTRYGYEIQYPDTWHVREDNPDTPGISIRHTLHHTDFSPARDYDQPKSQAFFCSLVIWENPGRLAIKDWLRKENPKHPALIAGKTMTAGDREAVWHEPSGNASYVNVWVTNNGRTYQVFSCEPSQQHAYENIFDLMLKTLRFIP